MPKKLHILHVENVLRRDPVDRIIKGQETMRNHLLSRPYDELRACVPRYKGKSIFSGTTNADLMGNLVQPRLTYHGTIERYVASSVRYGFLKSGQNIRKTPEMVAARCGNTYGCGVYSSLNPEFSLS